MDENIKEIINKIDLDESGKEILKIILEQISLTDNKPNESTFNKIAQQILQNQNIESNNE